MDNQKQYSLLMEAYNAVYDNISESHFKVGDEVICKDSGMEGEVIKLDKPDGKEDEKYYTVKREDGKKVKYAPKELKLAEEAKNGGASKKAETKFHTKLDKLVHKTFGSSPEEKKMKEDLDTVVDTVTSTVKPHIQDRARKRHGGPLGLFGGLAADRAGREVDAIGGDVKSGNYGSALNRTIKGASKLFNSYEPDKFDIILEYLVAEGYADTNQAALAIMANMSEEWRQSIVEGVFDFLPKSKTVVPGIHGKNTVLAKKGGVEGVADKSKPGSFTPQKGGWDSMDAARYSKEYMKQRPRGMGDPTTNQANRRVTPNRIK